MAGRKSAKSADKKSVAIIGAGRVGMALGLALKERGYPIVGVASRSLQSARVLARATGCDLYTKNPVKACKSARIIFITTPDREISKVSTLLAQKNGIKKGDLVIHTSGSLGVEALDPLKNVGTQWRQGAMSLRLAMHPLQTFSKLQVKQLKSSNLNLTNYRLPITNFHGCFFALEGDRNALQIGKKIIKDLGGTPIIIPKRHRILYHTGASIASNYLVTLIDLALRVYEEIGIHQKKGFRMLIPLIRGTLENIELLGIPKALTGPIERGEVEILNKQLRSMKQALPENFSLFIELGKKTLDLAKSKGTLSAEEEMELKKLFR